MNGYSLLLPGNELAFDHSKGRPYFVKTKRAATRAASKCMWSCVVVPVTLDYSHPNGLPTYTIKDHS